MMKTESKTQLPNHPDTQYSSQDTDQFSALALMFQQQSHTPSDYDNNKQHESARQFDYTPSDDAVFQKLLHAHNSVRRNYGAENDDTKKVQRFTKMETVDGYTNTDQENFTALMSFGENSVEQGIANIQSNNRKTKKNREFSYTDQDHLNFEQLNPHNDLSEVDQQSTKNKHQDKPSSSTDRDVGIIKIIEFGNTKLDRVKADDRPNENIKIRFFD